MSRREVVTIDQVTLENGECLTDVKVAYELVGTLSINKDNLILNCHALTGDIYAFGNLSHPGWWKGMIGPKAYLDTEKYAIITMNVIGGCYGTTGPSSLHPKTKKPFGSDFPQITIRDMVDVQYRCLVKLGINHLVAVVGGSMGGMQVLEWAVRYPDMMNKSIAIATAPALTPLSIAYNEIARQAIVSDPEFKGGDYYPSPGPKQGLSIARMIGMVTYKTEKLFHERFGYVNGVQSYLQYQGQKLVSRFDANTYLLFLQAMNSYQLGKPWRGLNSALSRIKSEILLIGITEDLYFPIHQQKDLYQRCLQLRKKVEFIEFSSKYGHDAFLVSNEYPKFGISVKNFIEHSLSLSSLTLSINRE